MAADHLLGIILWYRRMMEGMSAAMYPEALEERRKEGEKESVQIFATDGWRVGRRRTDGRFHPEYRLLGHLPINLTIHVSHGSPMHVRVEQNKGS